MSGDEPAAKRARTDGGPSPWEKLKKYGPPVLFSGWVDENKELLKPPVGNKMMWNDGDLKIMVVGGPNTRTDYHWNQTEEFFYQIKGDMVLKIVDDGEFKDVVIKEGEMYVLPGCVPHSPQRTANSIGLVIELQRPADMMDKMWWYCDKCGAKLNERELHADNLAVDLKPIIEQFFASEELRTCECGHTVQPPAKPVAPDAADGDAK